MHSPSQLVLHPPERSSHAVTSGFPVDQETPLARFTADEREAQKGEGFRPAKTLPFAIGRREAAKLDQPCLVRMQRQRELRKHGALLPLIE
jgi:hypothetical protein